jgi:hypothetical protein
VTDYDIHLDDKYGSLTLIDVPAEIAAHEPWFNQTLTTVNDTVVRLGVLEGDFHRHQGDTVPRRVEHRTRAPVRTAILMVEAAGVQPTGD